MVMVSPVSVLSVSSVIFLLNNISEYRISFSSFLVEHKSAPPFFRQIGAGYANQISYLSWYGYQGEITGQCSFFFAEAEVRYNDMIALPESMK